MTELQHGLLLVDKHSGCTSHDIVVQVRKLLRTKKIGHCGTLDPSATGLLLLTVGRATRLTRFLIRAPKVYEGKIRLGIETDTYDTSGQTVAEKPIVGVGDAEIHSAMETFQGTYMQTPPPYCAKKVGGVKYYELARRGEQTPDEKKPVTIYEFSAIEPYQAGEDLAFRLGCSSGTYARSLAHELGKALGCGGTLSALRRTHIGSLYPLEDALTIDALRDRLERDEGPGAAWIPFDEIPLPFDQITTDVQQERRIEHGQTVLLRGLEGSEGDWVKLVSPRGRFLAVGAIVERVGTADVGIVQPKVVFR